MSRTRCIELYENVGAMDKRSDERPNELQSFIQRELGSLIESFRRVNGKMSQEAFAKRANVDWRTIYNIIDGEHIPGVDTLNQILVAADSNLSEFFTRWVTRSELASIQRESREESEWIETLAKGLSHPLTKKLVQNAAESVGAILSRLQSQ